MTTRTRRRISLRLPIVLIAWCAVSVGVHGAEAPSDGGLRSEEGHVPAGDLGDHRLTTMATPTHRATKAAMVAAASAGKRQVVAGERGLIIYSDDCGTTWQQARVPVSVTLTALTFVDPTRGWAVGHDGVILATQDAGATWQKQLDGRVIAQLALVAAQKAAAEDSSNEAAQKALSDAERLVADGSDKPLFAVHFWTPERGIVVGAYGLALITDDAGATWQWIGDRIPNPMGLHIYGLWAHENLVYAVGEQGLVVRSDDGARSFQVVPSPYEGSYFGITGTAYETSADLIVYGLRGHAFRLSTQALDFQPLPLKTEASLLSALPRLSDSTLLFDADGQAIEVRGSGKTARAIGSSPVGPVLGATPSCGSNVVIAGLRGVAVVDATSMGAVSSSGTQK
ncbi:Ycf48-like protein [compost metagenome]